MFRKLSVYVAEAYFVVHNFGLFTISKYLEKSQITFTMIMHNNDDGDGAVYSEIVCCFKMFLGTFDWSPFLFRTFRGGTRVQR